MSRKLYDSQEVGHLVYHNVIIRP